MLLEMPCDCGLLVFKGSRRGGGVCVYVRVGYRLYKVSVFLL